MSPLALIGLLLAVAGGLFVLGILYTLHRIKQSVIGHILATFYTETGADYTKLCRASDKEVSAPSPSLEKYPKQKTYLISANHTFDATYPSWAPKFMRVTVPSTAYYEGNPNPIVSRQRDPKSLEPLATSELLYNMLNEKFTRVMVRFGDEFEHMVEAVGNMPNMKILYLLIGLTMLLTIVSIVFTVQVSNTLSRLASLWGM